MQSIAAKDLALMIDHTLLKAEATTAEVRTLCTEARTHGFATVCLNSWFVPLARELLAGSPVKTITVVGFPLGANLTAAKAFETTEAVRLGAQEIDMVINLGALRAGDFTYVENDIRAVVLAAQNIPVKVILETAALTTDEKINGCQAALRAGDSFVKTSTGFHPKGGATADDIRLMRQQVGTKMGVKASGGIRTFDDAMTMIAAGANRIGASSSVSIVTRASTPTSAY